jgi:hypothetical protein
MIMNLSSRKGSLPMVRLIRFLKCFFSSIFYVLWSQINAFNIDFMKAILLWKIKEHHRVQIRIIQDKRKDAKQTKAIDVQTSFG